QAVRARAPEPQNNLAERLLVGLVVGQTLAAIPRFHRRVEVVGKMLGDLSDAVSPEASEAYYVVDAYPRLEQHPEAPQRFQILLTRQLVGRRSGQPHSQVEAFEDGERDPHLFGDVGVRRLRSRMHPGRCLEVAE